MCLKIGVRSHPLPSNTPTQLVHCCPRITLKILQTLCKWLLSHVVEATSRVTPKVSDSQPSNVAAQNADASLPQSLHHPGVSPVPLVAIPQLAELVPVSSLPITTNVMVPSALAASGSNPSESVLVQQLQAEVLRLSSALQLMLGAHRLMLLLGVLLPKLGSNRLQHVHKARQHLLL